METRNFEELIVQNKSIFSTACYWFDGFLTDDRLWVRILVGGLAVASAIALSGAVVIALSCLVHGSSFTAAALAAALAL